MVVTITSPKESNPSGKGDEPTPVDEKALYSPEGSPPSALEDTSDGQPVRGDGYEGKSKLKTYTVIAGLMLSLFLSNLDRVIVATAMPTIASRFGALDQAPWIATSFLVTQAGIMLLYGQLMAVTSHKWVYFCAITIFGAGNLLCGVAWNFNVLLVGRAIVGIGTGGMFVAVLVLATTVSRLDQRPMLFAIMGSTIAVANIAGPLVGGALTDRVSWRWCFYINIPFGAVNMLIAAVVLDEPKAEPSADDNTTRPLWIKLLQLDWVGTALCFGAMLALLYPLQAGGVTAPWSDRVIIICFCVCGLLFALFVGWEYKVGSTRAALPLILFRRRTTVGIAIASVMVLMMGSMGHFYLPLYYQVARGHTAVRSGIDILGYMIGLIAGSVIAGAITKRTGRPWPFLLGGPLVSALASGLIFWAIITSPKGLTACLIVFQVALGASIGGVTQQTMIYVQAEYRDERKWIPQASAMACFSQAIGAVIGVAIPAAILSQRLRKDLQIYAPDLPAADVVAVLKSVTAIRNLDLVWREVVTKAYSEALGYVFLLGIAGGLVGSVAALFMKNHNLKQ